MVFGVYIGFYNESSTLVNKRVDIHLSNLAILVIVGDNRQRGESYLLVCLNISLSFVIVLDLHLFARSLGLLGVSLTLQLLASPQLLVLP